MAKVAFRTGSNQRRTQSSKRCAKYSMTVRISCIDQVIGSILAGWRYDLSGLASELRDGYEQHLADCGHCRSRQVLHRTIDIGLMIIASVSGIMFLVAFGAVRHFSPRHALVLELIALAGFLFFSVIWLIVAVATPAPMPIKDIILKASQKPISVPSSTQRSTSPPSTAKILYQLIPAKDREYLLGDLEEEFRTLILPKYGPLRANSWFWQQTLVAVGPFILLLFKRALGLTTLKRVIRK